MQRFVRSTCLTLAICFGLGRPCLSQTARDVTPVSPVSVVLVNAAMGGAAAVIGRLLAGKSVKRAAFIGVASGTTVVLGKWMVSRNSNATNVIGRAVAAVGSSQVSDAAAGKPFMSEVVIPYGILNFYYDRTSQRHVSARLNFAASLETLINARTTDQTFQMQRSILSGVPTFLVNPDQPGSDGRGSQIAGVITYRPGARNLVMEKEQISKMIGHEIVHVVQSDFLLITAALPAERVILQIVPGGRTVNRFLDLGLHVPVWSGANAMWPYASRPWEREAVTLAGR
jgi:hypothetical protein